MFRVSVVTPVYNAEKYLRRAVEAALGQEETDEVILVEDDSPDGSLDLCRQIEAEFDRVRLVRHPDGRNHGCGASRNLGVESARNDIIAFADADNFYLENRFKRDKEILSTDQTIDGVYNAQGIHYYSEKAKKIFFESGLGDGAFLSLSEPVPPEELLSVFFGKHATASVLGGIGIDALTLRRRAFDMAGMFKPELKQMQDVNIYVRLAATCRLAAGELKTPVAVRGVHEQMRSTNAQAQRRYRKDCWDDLYVWFKNAALPKSTWQAFEAYHLRQSIPGLPKWAARRRFLWYVLRHPAVLSEANGLFDFSLFDAFGRNWATLHLTSVKNKLISKFRRRQTTC